MGGRARDLAGLTVERNLVRLRPLPRLALVRVDETTREEDLESVRRLRAHTGTRVLLSGSVSRGADTVVETPAEFRTRVAAGQIDVVRWLSQEDPGDLAVLCLDHGVRLDRRPIAGEIAVEGPRWMHEQSVCITAHRYGNVGAGPQPAVPGADH